MICILLFKSKISSPLSRVRHPKSPFIFSSIYNRKFYILSFKMYFCDCMVIEYLRRARSLANRLRKDSSLMDVLKHYAVVMRSESLPVSSDIMIRGIPLPGYVRIRGETPRAVFHPHKNTHIPEYFAVASYGNIPVPLTVGVMYDGLHIGCISEDLTRDGKYQLFRVAPNKGRYFVIDPKSGAVIDGLPESINVELMILARSGKRLPLPISDRDFLVRMNTKTETYHDILLGHPSRPACTEVMEGVHRVASWRNVEDRMMNNKLERRVDLWSV